MIVPVHTKSFCLRNILAESLPRHSICDYLSKQPQLLEWYPGSFLIPSSHKLSLHRCIFSHHIVLRAGLASPLERTSRVTWRILLLIWAVVASMAQSQQQTTTRAHCRAECTVTTALIGGAVGVGLELGSYTGALVAVAHSI